MKKENPIIYNGLTLDKFQSKAIKYLYNGESAIVAAPTGTGKTLTADMSIDYYIKKGYSVIYTAPVKALSNQKYREFLSKFSLLYGEDKVGILTGDIVINEYAPLLIMTTEIYRNMLISSSKSALKPKLVIFDEIHYLGDYERGTIWEECLLLKPKETIFLGLSATIPNVDELAEWINFVKKEKVNVVKQLERAVPLRHAYYIPGIGFTDYTGAMNYKEVLYKLEQKNKNKPPKIYHIDLINNLNRNDFPCLYFSFSIKGCVTKTKELSKVRNYSPKKDLILKEIDTLLNEFKFDKSHINNFEFYQKALCRGIGIHHAGLLPVMKFIVEKLFEKGYLDIVYCTETFAVGINYPVKTVCFDNYVKYDGENIRILKQQEYFQMAGRSGRRGIDKIGNSITLLNPKSVKYDGIPKWNEEKIESIQSSFKINYNTSIHLYNNKDKDFVNMILSKNFAIYQFLKNIKTSKTSMDDIDRELSKIRRKCCNEIGGVKCALYISSTRKKLENLIKNAKKHNDEEFVKKLKVSINKANKAKIRNCAARIKNVCRGYYARYRKLNDKKREQEKLTAFNNERKNKFYNDYENRLKILDKLKYIDLSKKEIYSRGETLKNIYFEELLTVELIYSDFFLKYDEDIINAVLSGVDFIPRKDDEVYIEKNVNLEEPLRNISNLINKITEIEMSVIEKPSIIYNKMPCDIMYKISSGADITQIVELTSIPDGDLVNVVRRTLCLLKQIRNVIDDNNTIRNKIDNCIKKLDREDFKVL